MLRYLVPLVTLVVLLGRSVASFAAAGPQVDITCCCPDPTTCKCQHRDHGDASMKRCAGGEHFVSPELELASLPVVAETTVLPERPRAVVYLLAALTDDRAIVPEKPPF